MMSSTRSFGNWLSAPLALIQFLRLFESRSPNMVGDGRKVYQTRETTIGVLGNGMRKGNYREAS
jgi:hypothetical protein